MTFRFIFLTSLSFLAACYACEPVSREESSDSKPTMSSGLDLSEKSSEDDLVLGVRHLNFSFEKKETIPSHTVEFHKKQRGQMKFSFQSSGTFNLCGVLRQEKKMTGEFEKPPGFPKGVTDMKMDDISAFVVVHGYTGSWRREGAWTVGAVERRAMPSCEAKSAPYDGRRFWCTVLEKSPELPPDSMICGWEKAPMGPGWMTYFDISKLSAPLEFPASILASADQLHWLVMGSPAGISWTSTGTESAFISKNVEFNPAQFQQ